MTAYVQVISLVERLHRQFLEVVKLEIEGLGIHDINNVQGMMLFNIGDAEMTVGERNRHGKARISVVVERQCGLRQAHTLGVITRSLPRSQNRSSWRSVAPAP